MRQRVLHAAEVTDTLIALREENDIGTLSTFNPLHLPILQVEHETVAQSNPPSLADLRHILRRAAEKHEGKMMNEVQQQTVGKTYYVSVSRQDESHAIAESRGHTLSLNVKKGDGTAGFNAAETLLAALGTCILTNVNSISQKMALQIDDARLEFDAVRRDNPAALVEIRYRLILRSPEPEDKLRHLYELSIKWGTVTNTVINGLTPVGELVIAHSQ